MANKWTKRFKKAQDNFFDEQITYGNNDEFFDFDREYIKAKRTTSFTGQLCKISGFISMFSGLYIAAYRFLTGTLFAEFRIGIYLALAISGLSLMALGTIATNSKRQTALIAFQTWTNTNDRFD